jgi:nucleoid-associated protein
MPIRHCIVHLIDKKPDGTPAVLHARETELGASQAIENMLADLNESYNAKQGKAWGFFHEESGAYPFSGWLKGYLDDAQDFAAFSRQAVEQLQKLMEESNLSTGGHVLFAHYQQGMTDYLAIALLHHSEGVAVTDALDVTAAKHLDLSQLHLAAAQQRQLQAIHLVYQGQERQEGLGVLPRLYRLPGRCRRPRRNPHLAKSL